MRRRGRTIRRPLPGWVLLAAGEVGRAAAREWAERNGYGVVELLRAQRAARRAEVEAQWSALPRQERERIAAQWGGTGLLAGEVPDEAA